MLTTNEPHLPNVFFMTVWGDLGLGIVNGMLTTVEKEGLFRRVKEESYIGRAREESFRNQSRNARLEKKVTFSSEDN
jgi:hypothetical protein